MKVFFLSYINLIIYKVERICDTENTLTLKLYLVVVTSRNFPRSCQHVLLVPSLKLKTVLNITKSEAVSNKNHLNKALV